MQSGSTSLGTSIVVVQGEKLTSYRRRLLLFNGIFSLLLALASKVAPFYGEYPAPVHKHLVY